MNIWKSITEQRSVESQAGLLLLRNLDLVEERFESLNLPLKKTSAG